MGFLRYSHLRRSEYAGLSSVQFLLMFRRLIIYTFLALYLRSDSTINLSTTETSLLTTVGMVVSSIAQPLLWGRLLDRYKISSGFVIIGEITAGIGHFLMYFWHRSVLDSGNTRLAGYVIIISLGIIELPWSMSNVGWTTLIAEKTGEDERIKLMGQLSVVGGMGGIFGAYAGGILYDDGVGFSEGHLFYLAGFIMILSGIIIFFAISSNRGDTETEYSQKTTQVPPLSALPINIRNVLFALLISFGLIVFGLNSITLIAIFFIEHETAFGASDLQISLYRNVWSLFQIFAGLMLGIISNRVKDTKILTVGSLFALIALVWLPLAPSFHTALITPAFYGLSFVLLRSSSYSVIAKIIPEEFRGRVFGYYNSVFFLSWGLGSTLFTAPLSDYLISIGYNEAEAYRFSFYAASVLVIIGILSLFNTFRLYSQLQQNNDLKIQ
ncbi:MAG: MFS transporter [Candidatus Kariarchaeaceae archaeon]